ncbi:hypothetical protein EYC80_006948 [Monilinia laxa]|uniref:Uncharacterized protein n=1 Tax=Monilinia laxa TaxID=61186 RepID=A0A5N6JZW2_MONLA|nr:hypothetical protein EYC80_006948 [Monilinia laxa]
MWQTHFIFLAPKPRLLAASLFIASHVNRTKHHPISPQRHMRLHQMASGFPARALPAAQSVGKYHTQLTSAQPAISPTATITKDPQCPTSTLPSFLSPSPQADQTWSEVAGCFMHIAAYDFRLSLILTQDASHTSTAQTADLTTTHHQGSAGLCSPLTKRAVIMTQLVIKLTPLPSLAVRRA